MTAPGALNMLRRFPGGGPARLAVLALRFHPLNSLQSR